MLFETVRGLALQIPSAVQYVSDSLAYFRIREAVDSFQIKILNHLR
jgi:hypothetical protein